MSDFQLHPQLAADSTTIGEFRLSLLLMSNDANYPWFILVPKRAHLTEIHSLNNDDRIALLNESCQLAEALTAVFKPHKLNVAALGNMVPQLHIHHIVRYENDAAWPAPVWGAVAAVDYDALRQQGTVRELLDALRSDNFTALR